jgi:hypothetical protein
MYVIQLSDEIIFVVSKTKQELWTKSGVFSWKPER